LPADVILNVIGGMAGYWAYVLISGFLEPKKHAILISGLMIAFAFTGFYAGNILFHGPAPSIQGGIKEITNDGIVVSRIYAHNSENETTSSKTEGTEQFKVELGENCKITLVNIKQSGKVMGEKTIAKKDIILNDLILINKFLITENGTYMAMDVEIHRVE